MKFKITRSSDNYHHENQPHPKAVCVNEPPDMPDIKGTVAETFGEKQKEDFLWQREWQIEIDSLEELLEIAKVDHDVIVSCCDDVWELEIYDDWRE